MSNEFLEAALKERKRLLDALQHIPTYQQLKTIDGLIASYGDKKATALPKEVRNIPDPQTKRGKIVKHSIDCIAQNSGNAPVRVIREYLVSKGIDVPEGALSAYLSAEKTTFQSDRIKGWGLKDSAQKNTAGV